MSQLSVDSITGRVSGSAPSLPNGAVVTGVVTATSFSGAISGNVTGNVTGTATTATNLSDAANITTGTVAAARLSGSYNINVTGNLTGNADTATTATTATNALGLSGSPSITISGENNTGISTLTDLRLASIADKTTLVNGNTVTLNYSTGGGNVAICTTPSGPITLNVNGIPTTSDFDNRAISFAVIVQQGVTAYACSSVTLNGVSFSSTYTVGTGTHIAYSGGTVGTGNTSGYDVFNFTGINTTGSASTTTNYKLLSNVNGDYRLWG